MPIEIQQGAVGNSIGTIRKNTKFEKKRLTRVCSCGILAKRVAEMQPAPILENDTGKKIGRQSIVLRLGVRKRGREIARRSFQLKGIKHKSLILAQDERWRRA